LDKIFKQSKRVLKIKTAPLDYQGKIEKKTNQTGIYIRQIKLGFKKN